MSAIEHVLSAAKALSNSGKNPSVALLKSKLGNSVPMPLIIQGLQRFKSMDKQELAHIGDPAQLASTTPELSIEEQLLQVSDELLQLKQEFATLEHRLTQLEQQGKTR